MFYCNFCGRAFTRKFNLARHLKTKHNSGYNGNGIKNIHTNEYNTTGLANDRNSSDTTNITNKSNDSDVNSIIDKVNDKSEPLPLEINNLIQGFPNKKECFDQRMLAATEVIKQKFNSLKNASKDIHYFESPNPTGKNREEAFMNVVSENNNTTRLEAKLPELLQCMLDILMIKELQNVDIRDKDEETDDGENKNVKLKRRFKIVDKRKNVDEIKFPEEETPIKLLKYGNSMEHENDNSSINSECVVKKKYWHDPNTLVDELRNLVITTDIGQQISTIIRRLNEIKSINYFEYVKHKEEQKDLIRNLNELKKTDVGLQIFCIFEELEKAKIINSMDYVTDERKHSSDIDDENTADEDVTTGKGLYIQPYQNLIRV